MPVELRCAKCGKVTIVKGASAPGRVCAHCGAELMGDVSRSNRVGNEPETSAVTRALPWVISLVFHVCLAGAMMVVAMIVIRDRSSGNLTMPAAFLSETPGGVMSPVEREVDLQDTPAVSTQEEAKVTRRSVVDTGETHHKIELIAAGNETGGLASINLAAGGETSVRSTFYGSGGNAHHIVYVVDRSGSMLDSFDYVRVEMLRSVSRLRPPQDFHVILFSDGEPIEAPPKRLVSADFSQKKQAAEFLSGIRPRGRTDPTAALRRAFDVLEKAGKMPGKLIYLLTDGMFQDNAKVIAMIRKANASQEVVMNTYLYGHQPPGAVAVMKQIAEENGGMYRYVPAE